MSQTWIRRCQECFNEQSDREPKKGMTDTYANRKCRKCKSEALDFGTWVCNCNGGEYCDMCEDWISTL